MEAATTPGAVGGSRQRLLRVRAGAIAWALLGGAACGDDGPAEAEGEAAPEVLSTADVPPDDADGQPGEAQRDRTLVVAVRKLPDAFDPMDELEPWGRRLVDDALFEGLTRADPASVRCAAGRRNARQTPAFARAHNRRALCYNMWRMAHMLHGADL